MAIIIVLEDILKQRGMTSKELAQKIDITEANLSILRSGKAKAIRFETLDKICYHLNCEPKDIIVYEGENKWEK